MLNKLLIDYVKDTENARKNYVLGLEYEKMGQTAAAISFLLRASERTEDKLLAYECLIRIGNCFDKQKNRAYTVKSMYNAAIALLPDRPEAYYLLSKFQEYEKNYFESYTTAEIGLSVSKNKKFENLNVGYVGEWGLIFEKAVSAWWRGRGKESRILFRKLVKEYNDQLDEHHRNCIDGNLRRLGAAAYPDSFKHYIKNFANKLRYKFKGHEIIEKNYSQICQDLFVLSMHNGKRNGTFLEIGGADPYHGNNTYLLEKDFGWKGISIEFDKKFTEKYIKERPNVKVYQEDAINFNYRKALKENFEGKIIDYLQVDIEPGTYECLLNIPFDDYKFAVITYEHDHYIDGTKTLRDKSRQFLQSKGYLLAVNDLSVDGECSFEDWWVHPEVVDPKILEIMLSNKTNGNNIGEYMFIDNSSKEQTKNTVVKAYQDYDEKSKTGWGWCSLCLAGCLVDYVEEICKSVENPVCVEIGVYCGRSVLPVALELKRNKKGKVYAIDPWTKQDGIRGYTSTEDINFWNNVNYEEKYNFFKNVISDYDLDCVEIIRKTSNDAPQIQNINLLYIDGEHTDQALRDVEKYASQVTLNGYCLVDDLLDGKIWGKFDGVPQLLKTKGFKEVHRVDNTSVFKRVAMEAEKFSFRVNKKYRDSQRAFIVDNFYENPDEIREFAKQQKYIDGGFGKGFIGKRTEKQFLFDGVKEAFEDILGKKITKWEEHGTNGRFQLNIAGEPIVYHCDDQTYAAMIYLTPHAPVGTGTSTFMHKETKILHKSHPEITKAFNYKTFLDRNPYENVDKFGNVYNRLVIFDAGCIHGASEYFGSDFDDARLWHMFFFDA